MHNDWAKQQIDTLKPDFYGTLELEVRAGAVRKISRTETVIAPDIVAERDRALLAKACPDLKPLRASNTP